MVHNNNHRQPSMATSIQTDRGLKPSIFQPQSSAPVRTHRRIKVGMRCIREYQRIGAIITIHQHTLTKQIEEPMQMHLEDCSQKLQLLAVLVHRDKQLDLLQLRTQVESEEGHTASPLLPMMLLLQSRSLSSTIRPHISKSRERSLINTKENSRNTSPRTQSSKPRSSSCQTK